MDVEKDIADKNKLEGLGGWLILVGIGVVVGPVRTAVVMFPLYAKVFSDGSWEALTTPGSEAFHPFWKIIILGEIAVNIALLCSSIFMAWYFFTKKKMFTWWYIGLTVFTAIFILFDAAVIKIMLPNEPMLDPDTAGELGRTFIGGLIWIPYMLVSRRVKATFVN